MIESYTELSMRYLTEEGDLVLGGKVGRKSSLFPERKYLSGYALNA